MSPVPPRLIMTCVMRDEADLLESWLRYHRAQGVAYFLILDHRSIDDTPEILATYAERGWLSWFQESTLKFDQGRWATMLARLAASEFAADWVINNDSDEFWYSSQGSLAEVLAQVPRERRLIRAVRHNFAALTDYAPPFWQSQIYRFAVSPNFIGDPLTPKVCHRAEPEIIVHHGGHSVAPMADADFWPDAGFEIFHFPARTYPQFEIKTRNGGAGWVSNHAASVDTSRAKRQLYELYLTGRLPDWYRDWAYTPEQRQAALDTGELVVDTRFREAMQGLK